MRIYGNRNEGDIYSLNYWKLWVRLIKVCQYKNPARSARNGFQPLFNGILCWESKLVAKLDFEEFRQAKSCLIDSDMLKNCRRFWGEDWELFFRLLGQIGEWKVSAREDQEERAKGLAEKDEDIIMLWRYFRLEHKCVNPKYRSMLGLSLILHAFYFSAIQTLAFRLCDSHIECEQVNTYRVESRLKYLLMARFVQKYNFGSHTFLHHRWY